MTSIYPLVINGITAPTFYPTLDGNPYTCRITFNVSAQRYYINCVDSSNNLVFAVPIVSTMVGVPVLSLTWDQPQVRVLGTISGSFRFMGAKPGTILQWTLENMTPSTFNGEQTILVLSDTTFSYPQVTDPGSPTIYGALTPYINLGKSYFTSTLIFRNNAFEVSP